VSATPRVRTWVNYILLGDKVVQPCETQTVPIRLPLLRTQVSLKSWHSCNLNRTRTVRTWDILTVRTWDILAVRTWDTFCKDMGHTCCKDMGHTCCKDMGHTFCKDMGHTCCKDMGHTFCKDMGHTLCKDMGHTVCKDMGHTFCKDMGHTWCKDMGHTFCKDMGHTRAEYCQQWVVSVMLVALSTVCGDRTVARLHEVGYLISRMTTLAMSYQPLITNKFHSHASLSRWPATACQHVLWPQFEYQAQLLV
jgi:hypothetical protein